MVVRTDGTNDAVTISTPILASGTSSLTKSRAGTLTLTVTNTITGGVNLNAAQHHINNATALGTDARTLTINEGTTLDKTSGGNTTTAILSWSHWLRGSGKQSRDDACAPTSALANRIRPWRFQVQSPPN